MVADDDCAGERALDAKRRIGEEGQKGRDACADTEERTGRIAEQRRSKGLRREEKMGIGQVFGPRKSPGKESGGIRDAGVRTMPNVESAGKSFSYVGCQWMKRLERHCAVAAALKEEGRLLWRTELTFDMWKMKGGGEVGEVLWLCNGQ